MSAEEYAPMTSSGRLVESNLGGVTRSVPRAGMLLCPRDLERREAD